MLVPEHISPIHCAHICTQKMCIFGDLIWSWLFISLAFSLDFHLICMRISCCCCCFFLCSSRWFACLFYFSAFFLLEETFVSFLPSYNKRRCVDRPMLGTMTNRKDNFISPNRQRRSTKCASKDSFLPSSRLFFFFYCAHNFATFDFSITILESTFSPLPSNRNEWRKVCSGQIRNIIWPFSNFRLFSNRLFFNLVLLKIKHFFSSSFYMWKYFHLLFSLFWQFIDRFSCSIRLNYILIKIPAASQCSITTNIEGCSGSYFWAQKTNFQDKV